MKFPMRRTMDSPTPSLDSVIGGPPPIGPFLESADTVFGLELQNGGGQASSSSSSTCSSIIFPHLNLPNGLLTSSPEHMRSSHGTEFGFISPTTNGYSSSNPNISKCGICHESVLHSKIHHHTFCADCLEKGTELESPPSWEEAPNSSVTYSATVDLLKSFESASARLQTQYIKTQNEISEAFAFYRTLLDERKNELFKELQNAYKARQMTISVGAQRVQETLDRMYQTVEFGDRLVRDASPTQVTVFKKLLETRLQAISASIPETSSSLTTGGLEFVSNFRGMETALRNTLGYIRSSGNGPETKFSTNPNTRPSTSDQSGSSFPRNQLSSSMLAKLNSNNATPTPFNQLEITGMSNYETWSNASDGSYHFGIKDFCGNNGMNDFSPLGDPNVETNEGSLQIQQRRGNTPLTLSKNPVIKRQKMIYHCKFGEFGTGEAQFTEPSGVGVNGNNEIIVADTNNHRIQIFDREGRFKFQFGECGKRDGQLLYPNRVGVMRPSGDIVVTERSPTHQIQIYNQYGQFVRKFGANILQHPRGVAVDAKGRIIVVECKVMRVIIFDSNGSVLHKFGCSKHLEFPNGVVVNGKNEIFISDNRAHCVKVFSYEGHFLRQIGGEGLTNYPIGVGINANGEILVADNHNNFNLTIFTQEGHLISALESKVKHAQCFDVALMEDGSVVLASKDYRLYIYRYVQLPQIGN